MDERFRQPSNQRYLSKWVRGAIHTHNSFDSCLSSLQQFFHTLQANPPRPPETSDIVPPTSGAPTVGGANADQLQLPAQRLKPLQFAVPSDSGIVVSCCGKQTDARRHIEVSGCEAASCSMTTGVDNAKARWGKHGMLGFSRPATSTDQHVSAAASSSFTAQGLATAGQAPMKLGSNNPSAWHQRTTSMAGDNYYALGSMQCAQQQWAQTQMQTQTQPTQETQQQNNQLHATLHLRHNDAQPQSTTTAAQQVSGHVVRQPVPVWPATATTAASASEHTIRHAHAIPSPADHAGTGQVPSTSAHGQTGHAMYEQPGTEACIGQNPCAPHGSSACHVSTAATAVASTRPAHHTSAAACPSSSCITTGVAGDQQQSCVSRLQQLGISQATVHEWCELDVADFGRYLLIQLGDDPGPCHGLSHKQVVTSAGTCVAFWMMDGCLMLALCCTAKCKKCNLPLLIPLHTLHTTKKLSGASLVEALPVSITSSALHQP